MRMNQRDRDIIEKADSYANHRCMHCDEGYDELPCSCFDRWPPTAEEMRRLVELAKIGAGVTAASPPLAPER